MADQGLRLSEAMRLGAMLRPQNYAFLFDPETGTSCALGAAGEAVGMLDTTLLNRWMVGAKPPAAWRWCMTTYAPCPACDMDIENVERMIPHLNNWHWWTRERIADWVATLEPQPETPAVPDSAVPVLAK